MPPVLPAIVHPEGSPLAALAAGELRAHLGRLDAPCGIASVEIAHGGDPAGDGLVSRVTSGAVCIAVDGPRGALHAAFDLL